MGKRKDIKEKRNYAYEYTKDFWNCIFHDVNYDGYVYFCIKNKDKFENLHYCKVSEMPQYLKLLKVQNWTNYYFTPTHFRVGKNGVKRDNGHTFAYTCCVVDIDCHDINVSTKELKNKLKIYIDKLDCLVNCENYIPYNIVVHSGRGLQIIYCYKEALSYKVEFKHKKMQEILIQQHQRIVRDFPDLKLNIDGAATRRLSGLFRMPFTFNTATISRELVKYEVTKWPYVDVDRVLDTFDIENGTKVINFNEILVKIRSDSKPNIARCKKVIKALYEYQQQGIANRNNPGHENRNCSCFIFAAFSLAIMDYNQALETLLNYNNMFKEPLPGRRVKAILDYCLQNYTNDKKCNMRYFKNSTILQYLGIKSGELGIVVTDDYKYNPYYSRVSEEERKTRKKNKDDRNELIKKLLKNGMSYKEIAVEANVSLATIYRIAKKQNIDKKKTIKPWEKMGISKSTYYRKKKSGGTLFLISANNLKNLVVVKTNLIFISYAIIQHCIMKTYVCVKPLYNEYHRIHAA